MKINKYLNNWSIQGVLRVMGISAVVHIAFVTIYALIHQNIDYVNSFNIVGISLFFPQLSHGYQNFFISSILLILLLILVLYLQLRTQNKKGNPQDKAK
jgi:hypothetical protein